MPNKTAVVPVGGIFLFLRKSVFRPKSLRHTGTAHWAPKNNFLLAGAKGSEDRGIKHFGIMKFTVSSTAMANKLAAMAKVMNGKSVLPILSTFLLEVKDDAPLEVTASDLECVWHGSLDMTGQEGTGKVCIPASTLLDAVKNLPEQPITFIIGEENMSVIVQYANGHFDMVGQAADEYPTFDAPSDIRFRMEAATLCKAIDQSLFAVSYDTLRPIMNGINFTIGNGRVECAASDGHKLARNAYPLVEEAEDCSFLLSAKVAKVVKALIPKKEGFVEVGLDGRNIAFKTDTDIFSARLIEGRYPNYNTVIPSNSDKEATIDRQALLSAIRRVSVFAEKANHMVVMKFSGMSLLLTGHDFDNSTSAEETVFCAYQGEDIRIGFSAENLMLILENTDTAEVRFRMSEPCRAAIIEPASEDGQTEHLALLMPMMLPE